MKNKLLMNITSLIQSLLFFFFGLGSHFKVQSIAALLSSVSSPYADIYPISNQKPEAEPGQCDRNYKKITIFLIHTTLPPKFYSIYHAPLGSKPPAEHVFWFKTFPNL